MRQTMIHNTSNMPLPTQLALSFQHILAIFSGTIIVPIVTGLPIAVSLLFCGISTLVFQFFTRSRIPLFFSNSFVFIGSMIAIKEACMKEGLTAASGLCYASFGLVIAGFSYIIFGRIFKYISYEKITRLFPPVLYGSYIMALGIVMIHSSFISITTDWVVALTAIIVILVVQHWTRGTISLMPINIGVLAATVISLIRGGVDLSHFNNVPWIGNPFERDYLALNILEHYNSKLLIMSILTILPLVFISTVEHIADVMAISKTTKIDYIRKIGLTNTLSANGLTTILSSLFGAPPCASFTQTTGLIMMNRICDTALIRIAAITMIALAFSPKLAVLIAAIPAAAIGGVTLIMYGMVVVVGLRTLVDAKTNLSNTRNLIIASLVLVLSVGIKYSLNDSIVVFGIHFSALAVAGIAGTLLNIILPDEQINQQQTNNNGQI